MTDCTCNASPGWEHHYSCEHFNMKTMPSRITECPLVGAFCIHAARAGKWALANEREKKRMPEDTLICAFRPADDVRDHALTNTHLVDKPLAVCPKHKLKRS